MAKGKPALGRGLSALLDAMGPESAPESSVGARTVAVAAIEPNAKQPRGHFDQEALAELTDSVRAKGVLVPLLVRPMPGQDGRFELVAGERRWRAAQAAGLHEVPVMVRDMSDTELFEAALIENVQRADLNPAEEAAGYRRLMDEFGHRQEDVSRLTGKSRSHVANLLRLLDLPDEVLGFMRLNLLSMGHAKVLMGAENPSAVAREVVARKLSVRATEELIKRPPAWVRRRDAEERAPRSGGSRGEVDPDLAALEDAMEAATGLAVTVTPGPGKGGEVRIRYSGLEQLDLVVNRLTTT
jgi:ParB family chromosome partitioning protein